MTKSARLVVPEEFLTALQKKKFSSTGLILSILRKTCSEAWHLGTSMISGLRSGTVRELPRWHSGKESPAKAGDVKEAGLIPELGQSPGNLLQCSFLKKFHGQRNLVGCSPWAHEELDTTAHKLI